MTRRVMADQGQYNTIEEVADRLQVSDQTIRRWIKSGRLPAYKPGREWRIATDDLERFLEARSSPKATAPPSLTLEEEWRSTELGPLLALARSRAQDWETQAADVKAFHFSTWHSAIAWETAISNEADALAEHIDDYHCLLVGDTVEGAEAEEIERAEQVVAQLWEARRTVGRQVGAVLEKVSDDVRDPEGFVQIRRAREQAEAQTSARIEGLRGKLGA